jgi:hypothetical protein
VVLICLDVSYVRVAANVKRLYAVWGFEKLLLKPIFRSKIEILFLNIYSFAHIA